MAIRNIKQRIDDIDGTVLDPDSPSESFSLNGTNYVIDLSEENASRLKEALAPFIAVAAIGRSTAQPRKSIPTTASRTKELEAIRAWARSAGHEVANTGRIPKSVLDAYTAAN